MPGLYQQEPVGTPAKAPISRRDSCCFCRIGTLCNFLPTPCQARVPPRVSLRMLLSHLDFPIRQLVGAELAPFRSCSWPWLRSRALGEEIALGRRDHACQTHHLRLTGIRVDADLRAVASRIYSRASLGSAAAMLMNEIRKEKWSCKVERNKPLQEKGSNEGHRNLPQGR